MQCNMMVVEPLGRLVWALRVPPLWGSAVSPVLPEAGEIGFMRFNRNWIQWRFDAAGGIGPWAMILLR